MKKLIIIFIIIIVYIFSAVSSAYSSSGSRVVFEDAYTGGKYTHGSGSAVTVVQGKGRNGSAALEITLNQNEFTGVTLNLTPPLDITSYRESGVISFWVKRDISGGEVLICLLSSLKGREKFRVESPLNLADYLPEITGKWQHVQIPLSDYPVIGKYWDGEKMVPDVMNWSKVAAFRISNPQNNKGVFRILVDDIMISDAPLSHQTSYEAGKILIDDFEEVNPEKVFLTRTYDASSLVLLSAQRTRHGEFSLQVNYTLSTTEPRGAFVRFSREPAPADWSAYNSLNLWLYPDATNDIFRLKLVDEDDETWVYENHSILSKDYWHLLTVKFKDFIRDASSKKGNGKLDSSLIKNYIFEIAGRDNRETRGTIYLDDLYAVGSVPVRKKEAPAEAAVFAPRISFSLESTTKYLEAPEVNKQLEQEFKLISTGKIRKIGVRLELKNTFNYFGQSAVLETDPNSQTNRTNVVTKDVNIVLGNSYAIVRNLLPAVSTIQIGNVWVDWGSYVFAPVWGFKGAQVEGVVSPFKYEIFLLKHPYDAYTAGLNVNLEMDSLDWYRNWRSKLKWLPGIHIYERMVYAKDTARVSPDVLSDSTNLRRTTSINNILTVKTGDDLVTETLVRMTKDKVSLDLQFARNFYNRTGNIDLTDPYNRPYDGPVIPGVHEKDYLFRAELILRDLLLKRSYFSIKYDEVGPNFIPRYRNDFFDYLDIYGNKKGINLLYTRYFDLIYLTYEYEHIRRKHDKKYFKHKNAYTIGINPYQRLSSSFSLIFFDNINNHTDERYGFNGWADDRHMKEFELRINYDFNDRSYLQSSMDLKQGESADNKQIKSTSKYQIIYNHDVFTNASIRAEWTHTKTETQTWATSGYPYDDNRTTIELKINF